ncbi:MAG: CDP-diacylglycerol--glycerol-3-phosphate 3-phosphatidyltransferase [Bacillota bacterium]|jgi:CDP-diacylglycerol--glycerol-3-phosphate 3-phosphatidyltransferase/cardiolipin synthase|nr:CDP-diacylglycerol--glycerol-3-phosphate 3-phosphatidyltransferase [Eubacteriales bacterium]MDD3536759.1 CDP-diacylglycerol--glycerol-3-phosphate 3-phosphatidyltransferase [Eubacteriales bacterium]MDD4285655.1 CDP-diacylglycerol--glycerol-3-phosphate 3-phosphatidyltransferase [Eubacteriales bacterium]MDI9491327.1 CDP-diacylglycerol--glycerol-3-phosphate 3-phosphatidyltransferase [Bacillota bacterium]NLV69374.1 CDP-diacylglycerol--glycerol-3-phosphate 3-phosphatidyltransferase [Clostridiales 
MNLPNKLTVARVVLVPVFVVLYMQGNTTAALAVFLAASFTDYLDGYWARKYRLITNFGKIMDPLADKVLVYSAFCCMVENGTIPAWMLIVILAREFTVAGMRTVAASEGLVIAAGTTGKIKTGLQMIAVPLLILNRPEWIAVAAQLFLWASVIMTVLSGVEYIYHNRKIFNS